TDLFNDDTIERMLGHFQMLLQEAAENPDQPLSDFSLLTAAEQNRLLVEWNDTRSPYSQEGFMHRLFEEQARLSPESIAVASLQGKLTYRQLNERANKLARYLIEAGVEPETRVGVCMRRSPDLIVALMGIVKAGGVYVPLDAAYPRERFDLMLEDAQAWLLLTDRGLVDWLRAPGRRLVCLDSDWPQIDVHESDVHESGNPDIAISPQNLAYVIYTSGSTGRPKGVAIEHRNCAAFLSWASEIFSPADLEGT